ncbi:MAG: ABC transporter permease [candidate division WOR-3 bacterium]
MNLIKEIIAFFSFFARSVFIPWRLGKTLGRIVRQIYILGFSSIPLIVVISVFVGMVSAVQTWYQMTRVMPKFLLGTTVARIIMIELGPVLTALMVTGRISSSMAAELGTMKVTDQIDALKAMAIDPYRFLVLPRIIATFISLPILTIFAELVSILSAAFIAHNFINVNVRTFIYGITNYFYTRDFFGGVTKSLAFSLAISTSGCYFGFRVTGGAKEVGRASTLAVVTASILILLFDFIVALIFFS